eukprot:4352722-Amphidinium_carterae.1
MHTVDNLVDQIMRYVCAKYMLRTSTVSSESVYRIAQLVSIKQNKESDGDIMWLYLSSPEANEIDLLGMRQNRRT